MHQGDLVSPCPALGHRRWVGTFPDPLPASSPSTISPSTACPVASCRYQVPLPEALSRRLGPHSANCISWNPDFELSHLRCFSTFFPLS